MPADDPRSLIDALAAHGIAHEWNEAWRWSYACRDGVRVRLGSARVGWALVRLLERRPVDHLPDWCVRAARKALAELQVPRVWRWMEEAEERGNDAAADFWRAWLREHDPQACFDCDATGERLAYYDSSSRTSCNTCEGAGLDTRQPGYHRPGMRGSLA